MGVGFKNNKYIGFKGFANYKLLKMVIYD